MNPVRDHREGGRGEGRDEGYRAPGPKIEFPKFDEENPKLWQQQCETYFEVFRVQPCLHTGYAVLWLPRQCRVMVSGSGNRWSCGELG
jgi:hypothetical protein